MNYMALIPTTRLDSDYLHRCPSRSMTQFNRGYHLSGTAKAFGHPVP